MLAYPQTLLAENSRNLHFGVPSNGGLQPPAAR